MILLLDEENKEKDINELSTCGKRKDKHHLKVGNEMKFARVQSMFE